MALWAGIDEAGYGPKLGPLVVAGTAFALPGQGREGVLWDLLGDAVCRRAGRSDGRLVVNDSKQVYSRSAGLRRLEEGVLAATHAATGSGVSRAGQLLALLSAGRDPSGTPQPWFAGAAGLPLPVESNPSAVESKAELLRLALQRAGARLLAPRAVVVLPGEYNRIVARTRNKSLLLFQKCGIILQELWRCAGPGVSRIVVDRHGGRIRYRRLLGDVFPDCQCDVLQEEKGWSAYRISSGDRTLLLSFLEEGDARVMPVALGSMVAKYVRELYMLAFNRYWGERLPGLVPTAGYGRDAGRFMRDVAPALRARGIAPSALTRTS